MNKFLRDLVCSDFIELYKQTLNSYTHEQSRSHPCETMQFILIDIDFYMWDLVYSREVLFYFTVATSYYRLLCTILSSIL